MRESTARRSNENVIRHRRFASEGVGRMTQNSAAIIAQRKMVRRVTLASMFGTIIEWYDYFIYGLTAGLIFNQVFFPQISPAAGTLAAFASFAVGFLARPIGGVIFGHIGDVLGRKPALIATLLVMGLSTTLIGLLPTYSAIGIWAPILLVVMRLAQGLGAGGEWGGAVLMTVEHAPPSRRGLLGSTIQSSIAVGSLLASGVIGAVTGLTSAADFAVWGWRIPFLLSAVLVVLTGIMRLNIEEPQQFSKMRKAKAHARFPFVSVLRRQPGSVLIVVVMAGASQLVFYIVAVFSISYAASQQIVPASTMLGYLAITNAVQVVAMLVFGTLADRIGRRRVVMVSTALMGVFAFPYFWLLGTGSGVLILLAMIVYVGILESAAFSPQAALIPDLFDTRLRYSGTAVGYNIAALLGGTAPAIAATLIASYHSASPVALYIVLVCAFGVIGTSLARNPLRLSWSGSEALLEEGVDTLRSSDE
jgi:MFS transporter, MHS family, shikimate and dehydroshikimate transport protein